MDEKHLNIWKFEYYFELSLLVAYSFVTDTKEHENLISTIKWNKLQTLEPFLLLEKSCKNKYFHVHVIYSFVLKSASIYLRKLVARKFRTTRHT